MTQPEPDAFADLNDIPDDTPPVTYSPDESIGGRELWCEAGQHTFIKTGRGRDPKSCPEHRPIRSARSDSTPRSSRAALNIEQAVAANVAGIAQIVGMFNQFDGAVIAQGSPYLARSVADVAARDPKVRKAIEHAMSNLGWGQVIAAVMAIAIPIMVNHQVIPNPAERSARQQGQPT